VPLHAASAIPLGKAGQGSPRDLAQVDGLEIQFGAGDPCELQEVVDQLSHVLRGASDPPQMFLAVRAQPVAAIFEQCLTETVDAAQR
jgi:hypothetical protein